MTRDKIYGKYLHNLLVHAPLQYRLVSGESINGEDEERFFETIRDITHGTSNNSQKQWKFIIENNIGSPTHEILLGNEDEIVRYVPTSFLSDKLFCKSMLTNIKRM